MWSKSAIIADYRSLNVFISKSIAGTVYVTEHRHHRFRWFRYPEGEPVDAYMVPRTVRIRAYKTFELDRRRNRGRA
jgi:hypothetical protein